MFIQELILYIVQAIVDNPDEVSVAAIEGAQTEVLELTVANSDLGKAGCQFQKTTTGFVFEHVQRPFGSLFDLAYTFSPFKAFGFFGSVPLSNQQE
jgi:hypothetical protein